MDTTEAINITTPISADVVDADIGDSLPVLPPPLTIWAVSDGRAGIENQVLGLAEAIAAKTRANIEVRRIKYRGAFDRLPTALKLFPDKMLSPDSDVIEAPWPDIWIAAGRATIPHSIRIKTLSEDKTLVVQLQDPKHPLTAFDAVIAPEHDRIEGDTVLNLKGSTHRVTLERLQAGYARFEKQIEPLPHPRIAVLIGGKSKTHDLTRETAKEMVARIKRAIKALKGSILLTLSRRTPEATRRVFLDAFKDMPGLIYDGNGDNPYFAFLHAADHILVTEDSVNMVTEAATTGKPVHILAMDHHVLRSGSKFDLFHQSLQHEGLIRPFNGELRSWNYTPLNETQRAADFVLKLYSASQKV